MTMEYKSVNEEELTYDFRIWRKVDICMSFLQQKVETKAIEAVPVEIALP